MGLGNQVPLTKNPKFGTHGVESRIQDLDYLTKETGSERKEELGLRREGKEGWELRKEGKEFENLWAG